jgi:hypothetical protein
MAPQHMVVDIKKLHLDHTNPRIAKFLDMYKGTPSPDQIYLALGAGAKDPAAGSGPSFSALRESIRTNKGIIQPIIVNKSPNGKMVVLEGNTRLAIYQDFFKESGDTIWASIPAVVYDSLSQEEIDSIRLQAHLVGPRQWEPYAKGKYLHHLRHKLDFPLGKLIDYCGGRKKEVEDYIQAYIDIEKYYRPLIPEGGFFDATRFSGFKELQRSGIKESILNNNFSLEDFGKWIDSRLIDPLNSVRSLPLILNNDRSKQIFISEGAKSALKVLDNPAVTQVLESAKFSDLARALVLSIQKLSYNEFKHLQNNPESDDSRLIADSHDELVTLYDDLFGS